MLIAKFPVLLSSTNSVPFRLILLYNLQSPKCIGTCPLFLEIYLFIFPSPFTTCLYQLTGLANSGGIRLSARQAPGVHTSFASLFRGSYRTVSLVSLFIASDIGRYYF